VVWEKLDAIDGDTVYVDSSLKPPGMIPFLDQGSCGLGFPLSVPRDLFVSALSFAACLYSLCVLADFLFIAGNCHI
jgi:hypothetical protein